MSARREPAGDVQPQSLRTGSVQVAIGLAFLGAATYVFLAVTARAVGPARYADFAVFWGIVYGVGLGAFLPFEQEVSRRTAEGRERSGNRSAVQAAALRLAGGLILVLAAVLAVGVRLLGSNGPANANALWLACMVAFVGLAAAYITRGGLSGSRRFVAYAVQLVAEGAGRVVLCLVLLASAVASPWPFAFVVPVALLIGVAATTRNAWTGPRSDCQVSSKDLMRSMLPIVVSSTIAQLLVNFGPVVVRLLSAPTQQALAGRFLAAALVARLPLFLFAAIQAVLIPSLVAIVLRRDRNAFTSTLWRVLAPTIGLGLAGVALCAAAGPQLLRLALGPDFELPRRDVVLLGVSMALYLETLVLQPTAISLRQHRYAAGAWGAAGTVFVAACFLPFTALLTVELALIASCATAVVGLGLCVRRGLSVLTA
jgi:O-antigen/teichoic acid export membrane protein